MEPDDERLASWTCRAFRPDGVHREWLRQRARTQGALGRLATALNPYHYYVKAAEKRLFGSARLKAVICNSKMVKDEIRNYFGVAEDKLHVIYSGVDTRVFHPDLKRHRAGVRAQYVVPENATLFLFVGFARKGVSTLEAMARLSAGTYLLVVGHDKNLEKYQARAQRLGLGGRVRFAGRQGDVKPFYGAADGLVLPTLYDPFPNVALEAMASGVPVITSSKCGAAELIRDGENGFVCDALDSIALSERMRLLADREKGGRIGKAARETVAGLQF
jgi:UDP-glucose:(heptosyl)LPS alpha-1,3-glucosyltransferase